LECQNSKEQLNKDLSEKITTEVEKVANQVEKVIVEMDQIQQELTKWQGRLEQEMDEEKPQVIATDIIQGEVENNLNHVSRRLREHNDKLEQQNKDNQIEATNNVVNVILTQVVEHTREEIDLACERDSCGVLAEENYVISSYASSKCVRVYGETQNADYRDIRNGELPQMMNQNIQIWLPTYKRMKNPVGERISKSRRTKIKRKLQKWLQIYEKLRARAERQVNKNRKTRFKRQLQTWLRISNKARVRAARRKKN
jgi:hypothetical protein